VGVGQARNIEFDAKHIGDWMMHCHMPHHMMNQMVPMVGPHLTSQANTPSAADGSSGGAFSGGFLTAWYGDQPKYGRIIPGEISALLPVYIPGLG